MSRAVEVQGPFVGGGVYGADVSRFRLLPTPEEEEALSGCAVCVEFGGGVATVLATGPQGSWLCGAVRAVDAGPAPSTGGFVPAARRCSSRRFGISRRPCGTSSTAHTAARAG